MRRHVQERPKAVLGWVDIGGMRTPLHFCALDRAKLRRARYDRNTFYYDDVTVDPRYGEI